MEIKINWIKRKQMTHENTYRDDTIKSKKLKSDTSKLVKSLKNLIVESSVQTYFWFSLILCKSLALFA